MHIHTTKTSSPKPQHHTSSGILVKLEFSSVATGSVRFHVPMIRINVCPNPIIVGSERNRTRNINVRFTLNSVIIMAKFHANRGEGGDRVVQYRHLCLELPSGVGTPGLILLKYPRVVTTTFSTIFCRKKNDFMPILGKILNM